MAHAATQRHPRLSGCYFGAWTGSDSQKEGRGALDLRGEGQLRSVREPQWVEDSSSPGHQALMADES